MNTGRRAMVVGFVGALLAAGAGCRRAPPATAPLQGPVPLVVRNTAYFDVAVYALPSAGVDSRVRVATVTGNSEVPVDVPLTYVRPGGVLVLYLHAIGSRYSWTSPAVLVDPESVMRLDIYANPDGSLRRSTLYAAPKPEAPPPPAVAPDRALLLDPDHPEWRRPAPPASFLRFETTRGAFVLSLERARGPIGADRLYNMARLGYFDDTRVHRVRAGYIAQFGLHGDPAVNAAWKGRYLADDPPRPENRRGSFAFAYEGPGRPHTRNTQLYINLADNARNDAEPFTILGHVVEGMAVVDALYAGYGEEAGGGVRQGRQGPVERGGNAYLDREYPRLDRILRVTVQLPGG